MSIVIALIVVFSIAGLIIKFYPKPTKPTLAEGETLTPDPEPIPEVVIEPLVEPVVTPVIAESPKPAPVVLGPDDVPTKPQPKKKTKKSTTSTAKMSAAPKKVTKTKANA